MKHALPLSFLFGALALNAQVPASENVLYFDPLQDPVALRTDTTLQLLLSTSVLAQSVQTRLGAGTQVTRSYQTRSPKGVETLIFEGLYTNQDGQQFSLEIPLRPDATGRLWFADSAALVCSSPGCNNCSIYQGNCVGCCTSTSANASYLPAPLVKVPLTINEQKR